MRYRLSGHQRKEVEDRGRLLRIVIPLPDDAEDEPDALALARELLDVPAKWIRHAEVLEIPVVAPLVPGGSGLTGVLGEIAHAETRGDKLVYRIVCLSIMVSAIRSPRHDARGQWPGSVEIGGRMFPGVREG